MYSSHAFKSCSGLRAVLRFQGLSYEIKKVSLYSKAFGEKVSKVVAMALKCTAKVFYLQN